MATSLIDAISLIAIDVGAVNTRAVLFDVVDGRYRFVASGSAPTTAGAPFADIGEGLRAALGQLQMVTGRQLIGEDERLIIPSLPDGAGVDVCVATASVGAPLKVVAVGLLEDVSTDSAVRLASTTYAQVVDKLSLNDRRKTAARLDSILKVRPDLMIIAGGTEGGASQSVLNQLEAVGLACYLLPEQHKPEVLFVGNQKLVPEVEYTIASVANLAVAPNVRPTLEIEQLAPAQNQLAAAFRSVRSRTIHGFHELDAWSGGKLIPTATAFGRIIRVLSKVYDPSKGVFGVDIGSTATVMAAAFDGDLHLGVYSDLGLGERVNGILKAGSLEETSRWLTVELSDSDLRDYVYNKTLYPDVLPASEAAVAVEQALARQAMQAALARFRSRLPSRVQKLGFQILPPFEPILAAGSVFTNSPGHSQSLLMVLDGLQPSGVTTVVLDQNNLTPALGAAAPINPVLPVQVLESSNFLNLGTVISPVGVAKFGASIMKVRVTLQDGNESALDIKYGALESIPVPPGQIAKLHLQPLNRFDVGMGGPGRGGNVRVVGGVCGVVIDARGRPLQLPNEANRRRELSKKWLWALNN